MQVSIKQVDSGTYELTDWGEWVCTHEDLAELPPCCNGFDAEGNISCGCQGRSYYLCPNVYCTGIEDWQELPL